LDNLLEIGVDMNSETEIQLRLYKNNLAIGGRGYIIFGIWTVVKFIMELSMGDIRFGQIIDETVKNGVDRLFAIILTTVSFAILLAIIMIIHLMVGKNAVRFGKSQENRKRFYIYTSIAALINIVGLAVYPIGIMNGASTFNLTLIASLLVDLSVVFILIDLFYSALMIEKLIKQKSVEEEE
jgi:hypothetical protein